MIGKGDFCHRGDAQLFQCGKEARRMPDTGHGDNRIKLINRPGFAAQQMRRQPWLKLHGDLTVLRFAAVNHNRIHLTQPTGTFPHRPGR